MLTYDCVNSGSGSGLSPFGTKPLPKPVMTYHQQGPEIFVQINIGTGNGLLPAITWTNEN